MNPPFSCRGSKVWTTKIGDLPLKSSISIAFVLRALLHLSQRGQILAILPAGCICSQKDQLAWKVLRSLCKCELLGRNGHRTFRICFPHTVSIRLTLREKLQSISTDPMVQNGSVDRRAKDVAVLSRGNVDMATLPKKNFGRIIPLLHTTEMKEHKIKLWRKISFSKGKRIFEGPGVLIPRVGNPRKDKIVLYTSKERIATSSCILTISCQSETAAKQVFSALIQNWSQVKKYYTGTCARYMTLENLQRLLAEFGFRSEMSPCVLIQVDKSQPCEDLMQHISKFFHQFHNGRTNGASFKGSRPFVARFFYRKPSPNPCSSASIRG